MRPPSRWLAPGARTAMPPPLSANRRQRQGTRGPPPLPPPPRTQAQERTEADRRNDGPATPSKRPLHPGCGGTTAEARARTPCPLPADGGPAAPRTVQTERRFQRPARGRRGREPGRVGPPPLPPPPRRTDPLAADRTAPDARGCLATPTSRVYPGGARRRQLMAGRRPTGRGGGEAAPPPPPPCSPPPAWEPQERPTAHLEPRPPPLPQKGPRRGGGGCGWTCTPRAPAPPAACSRGGHGRRASPHQRAGATRGPSLGAAHGGAPEKYGGRGPHDPPMATTHSGRAEGGSRSAGAPGGAVQGPPLVPPHPGANPRPRPHAHAGGECADGTRGARMGYRGPPPRGGAGRPRRETPPPTPPTGPQAAGAPAPTPRGRGDVPPSPRPREEQERGPPPRPGRRLPEEPRRTSEPAPTRQDAAQIAPRESGGARTRVVWGATPPMDRTTPVTPALLPPQGRQRDGTRQSDPPPYRPPPAAQTGGTAHAPPPKPAPRHTNATDPPRGTQPPQGVKTKGTE